MTQGKRVTDKVGTTVLWRFSCEHGGQFVVGPTRLAERGGSVQWWCPAGHQHVAEAQPAGGGKEGEWPAS